MNRFLKRLIGALITSTQFIVGFLSGAVGFLAGSAQADREDDGASDPAQGGVLNYRTGKLDDGTDPVGWYERD